MPEVDSSAIDRIEYDAASRRLSIWFKRSRRYVYEGVPALVYQAFSAAASKGRYFNDYIRDRYRFS